VLLINLLVGSSLPMGLLHGLGWTVSRRLAGEETRMMRTTMVLTSKTVLTPRELFQWQQIYEYVKWLNVTRKTRRLK
jgi:hypothetical protein